MPSSFLTLARKWLLAAVKGTRSKEASEVRFLYSSLYYMYLTDFSSDFALLPRL